MIRVVLPHHLQTLANTGSEVELDVAGPVTQGAVLDALESRFPMLRGTVREHGTFKRRPRIRFFAAGEDVSLQSPETALPATVAVGESPFIIVGAIAGG